MLAGLVALPAALPAAAAAVPIDVDPIFGAIDAHRKASAAHMAAIDEAERLGLHDWSSITEKPCDDENDAFKVLVEAAATTLPGLLAKLNYLRVIAESDEAWMLEDREGTAVALINRFAASLRNVGVLS